MTGIRLLDAAAPEFGSRRAGGGLLRGRGLAPFAAGRVGDGQLGQLRGVLRRPRPQPRARAATSPCGAGGLGPCAGFLGEVLPVADLGLHVRRRDGLGPAVVLNLRLELAAVHGLQQRRLVGELQVPHRRAEGSARCSLPGRDGPDRLRAGR